MNYKISDLAIVSQGSILTRIKSTDNKSVHLEALTMQELTYYCNQTDERGTKNEISIDINKFDNCLFSLKGDVVVGLSSGNAMVIDEERSNKLVLSNFADIRIKDKDKLDPYYLCWLINESIEVKRQLLPLYQKSTRVNVIPISTFKDIEIECCDIAKQKKIGETYNASRKLIRIKRQKSFIAHKIINYMLKCAIKENIKGE